MLLYKNGKFCLSRNFRNQIIGDFNWLFKTYNFGYLSGFIDELIILNVEKDRTNRELFFQNVQRVLQNVFIPVSIGGGIRTLEDAKVYFDSGADKIILNSALYTNKDLINQISDIYGAQSIIASIDYKKKTDRAYIENGQEEVDCPLQNYIEQVQNMEIGEMILNSIEQDGTGFGFDVETIIQVASVVRVPFIVAGGAGKKEHFLEVAKIKNVDGFTTANLLNFIGEAIPNVRHFLRSQNINLANF
jgi:cyclase